MGRSRGGNFLAPPPIQDRPYASEPRPYVAGYQQPTMPSFSAPSSGPNIPMSVADQDVFWRGNDRRPQHGRRAQPYERPPAQTRGESSAQGGQRAAEPQQAVAQARPEVPGPPAGDPLRPGVVRDPNKEYVFRVNERRYANDR